MIHSIRRPLVFLAIAIAVANTEAEAQPFSLDGMLAIPGVELSSVAWADFDLDGDLDFLVAGATVSDPATTLIRNTAGVFTATTFAFTGVASSCLAWCDYDRDGDLDVAVAGTGLSGRSTTLYNNNGGGFANSGQSLAPVELGCLAWADFDQDGDQDLLLSGDGNTGAVTILYRNDAGSLLDAGAGLPQLERSAAAWADYDNDGDQDLLLCGLSIGGRVTRLYRNDSGVFTDAAAGLPGVELGSCAWGDYDADGDLDIALAGQSNSGRLARIYRNDGGAFVDLMAALPGVSASHVAWGDSDNDGDLDLALMGNAITGRVARLYRNDGGAFVDSASGFQGADNGWLAWGDCDQDRDLDLLIVGAGDMGPIAQLYRNGTMAVNTRPAAPPSPSVEIVGTTATFRWDAASDSQTPSSGLTYNLRVGTTVLGSQVMPGMNLPWSGERAVVQIGNVGQQTAWTVRLPALGAYTWSVQAVDGAFAGSSAPEQVLMTSFMDAGAVLEGIDNGAAVWGDYDADGDLDLCVSGLSISGRLARIYRNDGGTFVNINAALEQVYDSAAAWGDYDADGDLDLVLCGNSNSGRRSRIYRNVAGIFTNIGANLYDMDNGAAAWGDYDNDGDLDLVLNGYFDCCGRSTRLYRNQAGVFTDVGIGIEGLQDGSIAWGDYDSDSDLDLLVTGLSSCCRQARIYRNTAGSFSDINANLEPVWNSSGVWGDYDADGDLDILYTGENNSSIRITRIYRNNGGTFTNVAHGIEGVDRGSAHWGDYDNDGDSDVLLAGISNSGGICRVYRNVGGTFTDIEAGLVGVQSGVATWGDHDQDGDLDIVVAGNSTGDRVTRVYRNNIVVANAAPSAPGGLMASVSGTFVTLSWGAATDATTPSAALSYNIRIGTSPGASDVMAAMANPSTGARLVAELGNSNQRRTWTIKLPGPAAYYWSVQAIDAGYRGGQPAPEQVFVTSFSEVATAIEGVEYGSSAWGDYDNDGDLDLLMCGITSNFPITRIYRNQAGVFTDINAGLEGIYQGEVAWGDYDRDGDLDILAAGYSNNFGRMARIYRNNAGSFADINAGFEGVQNATVSWVDYDNDGDLDAFTAGQANCCGVISRLYTNQNGSFMNSEASIQGMYQGSAAWGDYDNDGDHDLLLAGILNCCGRGTRIFRNNNGSLSDMGPLGLEAVDQGTVAWGDYDNDGDLDVLMVGYANCCGRFARVYRNQGGTFSDIGAGLEGVYDQSSAAWGDFDNDGDLDIALSGYADGLGALTRVYANQAGSFTHIDAGLEGMQRSAVAWGDYDRDGDLDLFLTGLGSSARIARLYRNNATTPNTPPAPPTGLDVSVVLGGAATFSWSPSTDAQTPSPALTYNLRVGTTPGGSEVSASMAAADGTRRVVQLGNANHRTSWGIPLSSIPLTSRIYFSVQALDHSFAGSPFSEERAFGALPTIQSITDVGNDQGRQVRVRWEKSFLDAQGASPSVTGYAIWRRVDAFKPAKSEPTEPLRAALPPGDWDYLVTVPARGDDYYNVVVPTLCDSTIDGVCYSTFFVSGLTSIPTTFFDSAPDSGYSIDNLSPSIPLGLIASLSSPSEATLTWNEGSDADLRHYVVYRSPTPGFMPIPALRVGYASEPNFQDALYGPGTYYYRVTAVDFAGNESAPSIERFVTTTATDVAAPPARDELHAAQPNPFNPSTTIAFELAAPSDITIAIYDARGTRIATLLATHMPAGRHSVVWDGRDDRGRGVRSGAYFCKLTSASFHAEQKLTLLR